MSDEVRTKQCNHDDCKLSRMAIFDRETATLECAADNCTGIPAAIISSSVDTLYLCYFHAWKYLSLKVKSKVTDILDNVLGLFPAPHGEHKNGS